MLVHENVIRMPNFHFSQKLFLKKENIDTFPPAAINHPYKRNLELSADQFCGRSLGTATGLKSGP